MADAEHAGDGEPVDVGVHHTHFEALAGQGGRQVRRHRGLADSALARGDGDDPGEGVGAREGDLPLGPPAVELLAQGLALLVVHDAHLDVDVLDAVKRSDAGRHVLRDGRAERTARSGEEDLDVHDGAVDADQVGGHHVDVGDGAADLGVDDLREGIHDHVD